jgi:membrane protein insertase Oxa1/YidC/SpoIIIJ
MSRLRVVADVGFCALGIIIGLSVMAAVVTYWAVSDILGTAETI